MGKYGPQDVAYIQANALHVQVDRLLGALLSIKPKDPMKYFRILHRYLKEDHPEEYSTWFETCPPDSYLHTPRLTPRGHIPSHGSKASMHAHQAGPSSPTSPGSPVTRVTSYIPGPMVKRSTTGSGVWRVEGESCVLYNSKQGMVADFQAVISQTANFDPSYPALCNGKKFSLQNQVHWKLRLATLFLRQIGRDTRVADMVKSSKGHYEYDNQTEAEYSKLPGLPNVKLANELSTKMVGEREDIVISAERLHAACTRAYGAATVHDLLHNWHGFLTLDGGGERAEKGMELSHCKELFGDGEFRITFKEVCDLHASARVYTGADLPPKFFLHLVGITSRDSLLEYYYVRKSIPLAWMASSQENGQLCQLGQLILELLEDPKKREEYGFKSKRQLARTLQQSLTELSTQACIAIHGYFFGGNYNQIHPRPLHPILFLSAPGIDFNAGGASRIELSKYFFTKEFLPKGRDAFKARVKRTYHILFTACQEHKVTHPTAIAMGLGLFLPPIEKDEVKLIYHEAQFELLASYDYGFDTYFLNPGPGKASALQLLDENTYDFKCKVMIHFKDGKALCSQLANAGFRTSFLNPSDCIAVMQGCIGYWWETGLGERYAGEEDFCATSTAILARANVCRLWSAVDRGTLDEDAKCVIQVKVDGEVSFEEESEDADETAEGAEMLEAFWPAYPKPGVVVDNPPAEGFSGYAYEWVPKENDTVPKASMKFFRILWVDSQKHHELHLQPMINRMRRAGIIVEVAHSTQEAKAVLNAPSSIPVNFVLTSLFMRMIGGTSEDAGKVDDTGHRLLQEINEMDCPQNYFFRTVCASMTAINSSERSKLYSEGCNLVQFDLHTKNFAEVMDTLCFVQRHSDRLCAAIASHSLEKAQKTDVVDKLIQFGVNVNFPPKAWAPLHFAARERDMDLRVLELLLQAKANVETGTRYTTHGVPKGSTPLHVAVEYDNPEAVKLLLRYGASPHTPCELAVGDHALVTPLQLAGRKCDPAAIKNTRFSAHSAAIKGLLEKHSVAERPPGQAPKMKWHSMLSVLWISTSGELSSHTQHARRLVGAGALVVQTVQCNVSDDDDEIARWITGTLHPIMEDVGTDLGAFIPEHRAPLLWLQCVVLELTDFRRLKVWLAIIQGIKARIRQLREPDGAPWLRIITYAEGFDCKPFEGTMTTQPYLIAGHGMNGTDGMEKEHVTLNTVPRDGQGVKREVICESGLLAECKSGCQTNPNHKDCTTKFKQFYYELSQAVTHWAWDAEDRYPLYPDYPYDAKTSSKVEDLYRNGAPNCWVSSIHKVYFREMFQRDVHNPMRLRLVFRYPQPCFDCEEKVRSYPKLLKEIADGRCLVFIGAGYCIPAGGPSWGELLRQIGQKGVTRAQQQQLQLKAPAGTSAPDILDDDEPHRSVEDMTQLRDEVDKLVAHGADHTQFELAAQLLEDALGKDMKKFLAETLKQSVKRGYEILKTRDELNAKKSDAEGSGKLNVNTMASRLNYIQSLKFFAILTTNYSQELCVCKDVFHEKDNPGGGCGICRGVAPLAEHREPPYLDIIRMTPTEDLLHDRPIIQIHGSVSRHETIVLSREGYRSLLHMSPNYRDFLKSIMMSRTILYIGFSFTDDYLNEVRSDVMSMKRYSPHTKNLAYAIINDKSASHCNYYDQHEGVKFLTWETRDFGYGVMDRYLDSILNMTDTGAALSGAKVVLFSPPDDLVVNGNQDMMKLRVELQNELHKSQVFKVMPVDLYQKFKVLTAETLSEVERTLKQDDFLQSWVVTFADESWDSIPMTHRELINFLWHPHARLNTAVYPPILLVWGHSSHLKAPEYYPKQSEAHPLPLKDQYEANLHVRFCTTLEEVLATFRRVSVADVDKIDPWTLTGASPPASPNAAPRGSKDPTSPPSGR